ncbi:MAG: M18 family aminopeptidase [Gammaproteobacteria bacterium AqS3]|nr:M18 family aminopeptidase [Gammaproteobacteria bacterium AqS3]
MWGVKPFASDLSEFLDASPTPFHAVARMRAQLVEAGFRTLRETDDWGGDLPAGGYVVERNGSTLLAFTWPGGTPETLALVGAHTDSPNLRPMPNPLGVSEGYLTLAVQVYGGALLAPWFDRELGLAGRVIVRGADASPEVHLVDSHRPVGLIPSLAIHLDRKVNSGRAINPTAEMHVVLGRTSGQAPSWGDWLRGAIDEFPGGEVLACELSLYDATPARILAPDSWIVSARLDNLLSCHAACRAMLRADAGAFNMLACHDHEEIGSRSWPGAQGDTAVAAIERLVPDPVRRARLLAASLMLSVDNAHGVHPNFAHKHAAQHRPLLGGGPVLKLDEAQRYAGDSLQIARLRLLAERADIPLQVFSVRPDMACGSTIGPISAANLGLPALDIGVPQWAMHSVRESASALDAEQLEQLLAAFWSAAG